MITVIAKLTIKTSAIEEAKTVLTNLVAPTRAEAGCISYTLHQEITNRHLFFFYEQWADKAALKAHSESAHYRSFKEKIGALSDAPAEVSLVQAL